MYPRLLVCPVFATCCLFTAAAVAGKYNPKIDIGDPAPAWENLPGVDGERHSLSDLKEKDVVVVAFTCNSCPYAIDYEDRLIALAEKYNKPRGDAAVVAINVNKVEADRLPAMKERAEEKGFNFPYLYDESQQIAKEFGAIRTPEFFVLDQDRRVIYMGSMDDHPQADQATVNYVGRAIEAALAGETPETAETIPFGCSVRYERQRRTRR